MTFDEADAIFERLGLGARIEHYDVVVAQAVKSVFTELDAALADYAMLRAVARMCFQEDASEDSMLRLWTIAAMVDHPGAPLVIRYNRAAVVVAAARAWAHARETLNGIDAAETALLAAVAGCEKGVSE